MPIRTVMNSDATFASYVYHLPRINSLVAITAKLDFIESNSEPGSVTALRAAVSVETISHLTGENDMVASHEDQDMVTLKTRLRKYAAPTKNEERDIPEKPLPTTSSKGKHRLTLTLDGPSGSKGNWGEKKRRWLLMLSLLLSVITCHMIVKMFNGGYFHGGNNKTNFPCKSNQNAASRTLHSSKPNKKTPVSTVCTVCQELDGSWLLNVSNAVVLWKQGFSGTMVRGSDESAELKLDRWWEEFWDCQERDEYKTEGKV